MTQRVDITGQFFPEMAQNYFFQNLSTKLQATRVRISVIADVYLFFCIKNNSECCDNLILLLKFFNFSKNNISLH